MAALRRAKRHPHQVGDHYRALAQVEESVADLDASFRKVSRRRNVVIAVSLTAGPMIGRNPRRQVVDEFRAPEIEFGVDRAIAFTFVSNLLGDEAV